MTLSPSLYHQSPQERRQLLRTLVLLGALLVVEALGLLVAAQQTALAITRFSVGIALSILAMGLLTAVARPGQATRLGGVLAILLAGFLILPADLSGVEVAPDGPVLRSLPWHLLLRLINVALAIAVGVHLTARFPERSPALAASAPSDRRIFAIYCLSTLILLMPLLLPRGIVRLGGGILTLLWFGGLLGLVHLQLIRVSRDPDPDHRRSARQARLLLLGFVLAETPLLLRLLFFALGHGDLIPYHRALLGQVAVPIAVTYAILRHDLFDIDATVRRALAYTALTVILLALALGVVLLPMRLFTGPLLPFQPMAVLGSLLLAAVLLRLFYGVLQRSVDRLFYPERLRFEEEIAWARRSLQQVLDREGVVTLLTRDLPQRLDLTWASLALVPMQDVPGRVEPAAVWNERLLVGERVLGRYWIGPRRSGLPFDAREQNLLRSVVEQAALCLAYAETLAELQDLNRTLEQQVEERTAQVLSQQRALAAAEERRRLARALHDSVNQTLFSISLGARALKKLVSLDPTAAVDGLAEQESAAQQALAEMRALLAQLRTPLLKDGDLLQGLRHHCEHVQRQLGVTVHLDVPPVLLLPETTANELLYVIKEAIHNAVKHANVADVYCRITRSGDAVHLTVQDEGQGFDPGAVAPAAGHSLGLDNMRQRIEQLGGIFSIQSVPGAGTTISAQVPVENRQS